MELKFQSLIDNKTQGLVQFSENCKAIGQIHWFIRSNKMQME